MHGDSRKLAIDSLAADAARARTIEALFGSGGGAPTTIGRYAVQDVLGRGGMGVVYLAHDAQLERPVAVKLLSGGRRGSGDALIREAQQLAKVQHANVVGVYEVGRQDESPFLVMEYVAGPTLREWVRAQPRSGAEIRRMYIKAGRGLAAVHAAGLLHRDFKPSNVLVGPGDRPMVVDFGLAKLGTTEQAAVTDEVVVGPQLQTTRSGESTGVIAGTPLYMAPEQFFGGVSELSDQFAFGVALAEALTGSHPFDRRPAGALEPADAAAMFEDRVRPHLKAWLYVALKRAVSFDAEDRWPEMDALLRELADDPAQKRRRWAVAAVGAVGVLCGGGGVAYALAEPTPCAGVTQALDGVWDPSVARTFDDAVSGNAGAADQGGAAYLREAFDGYRGRWLQSRGEACEATLVRAEQSAELLDLRYACLERQRLQFAAAVNATFAQPAAALERPQAITAALPPVTSCDDTTRLLHGTPAPSPADAEAISGVRAAIAEAAILERLDQFADAVSTIEAVEPAVGDVGYPPLRAEYTFRRGSLAVAQLELDKGRDLLSSAFFLAQEHRYDDLAARAATTLAFLVASLDPRSEDEADIWVRMSEAAAGRAGISDAAAVLATRAAVAQRRGQLDDALALLVRAEAAPIIGGPLDRAVLINNRAAVLRAMGRHADAEEVLRDSLRLHRTLLGDVHPLTLRTELRLATILRLSGKLDEAEAAAVHAADALRGTGTDADLEACSSVGLMWSDKGDFARGCPELKRCVELAGKLVGPEHVYAARHRVNLGACLSRKGDLAGAEAALVAAIEPLRAAKALDVFGALTGYAEVLAKRAEGEPADVAARTRREAEVALREAIATVEDARGKDSPVVAIPLLNYGAVLIASGRAPDAIEPLRRSLALRRASAQGPGSVALAQAYLALAQGEPARADAAAAVQVLREYKRDVPPMVDAWLREGR